MNLVLNTQKQKGFSLIEVLVGMVVVGVVATSILAIMSDLLLTSRKVKAIENLQNVASIVTNDFIVETRWSDHVLPLGPRKIEIQRTQEFDTATNSGPYDTTHLYPTRSSTNQYDVFHYVDANRRLKKTTTENVDIAAGNPANDLFLTPESIEVTSFEVEKLGYDTVPLFRYTIGLIDRESSNEAPLTATKSVVVSVRNKTITIDPGGN